MILTGHQPNYLPYPGFFHKILESEQFLIVDTVQFVKRGAFGWIHRNRIRTKSPEGWSWLTVPVLTHGKYFQSIQETRIDNRLPWRRKHWRTLREAYQKAPGFAEYGPVFEKIYEREWASLAEINEALIREILAILGIARPILRLSDMTARGKASELIVNFCKELGANEYLSGVHGRDYLDLELFDKAGIKLSFQEFRCPEYTQAIPGPHIANLSILDLLFCCGAKSLDVIRSGSSDPTMAEADRCEAELGELSQVHA